MPSNKRYTNVYFTKRVDHEAGHATDLHPSEPSVCEVCDAIYLRGHWTIDKTLLKAPEFENSELLKTVCPACRQMKTGEPAGFVYLEGKFFNDHKGEITNLLRHESDISNDTNPLARIMDWKEENGKLTVSTTTEHLAQHLGRSLKRAYDGEVRYDFSHENKLARVYWKRN